MPDLDWKDRVIDALIVNGAYCAAHETDPKLAVEDLIRAEVLMATDPAIAPVAIAHDRELAELTQRVETHIAKAEAIGIAFQDLTARIRAVESDRILDVLAEVVRQACTVDGDTLDSMFLAAYSEALHLLAALGRVEIVREHSRGCVARWIPREVRP